MGSDPLHLLKGDEELAQELLAVKILRLGLIGQMRLLNLLYLLFK
jgi:hypothetical protein